MFVSPIFRFVWPGHINNKKKKFIIFNYLNIRSRNPKINRELARIITSIYTYFLYFLIITNRLVEVKLLKYHRYKLEARMLVDFITISG